jgi:hypothetical protein
MSVAIKALAEEGCGVSAIAAKIGGGKGAGLKSAVKCAAHFRRPCSSFEKGAKERRNGILRRFAKNRESIGDIPAEEISMAAHWSNIPYFIQCSFLELDYTMHLWKKAPKKVIIL